MDRRKDCEIHAGKIMFLNIFIAMCIIFVVAIIYWDRWYK